MRQPSLYEYFDSKHALYDAMFADGNRQLLERLEALPPDQDPRRAVKPSCGPWRTSPSRTMPVTPSSSSARSPGTSPAPRRIPTRSRCWVARSNSMAAAGVDDPGDVDCIVAVVGGPIDAQTSNDPGGDRWVRHLDRLIDLHLDDANRRSRR